MENKKKILQPSARAGNNGNSAKPKSSTPVRDMSSVADPNLSQISSVSHATSKTTNTSLKPGKENHVEETWDDTLIKLKSFTLQMKLLFQQHSETQEDINKQISELKEKCEKEKKEVEATINAMNEISCIEKRYQIEKEKESLASCSGEHLEKDINQFMTAVNHERNKLELKNIAFVSDEQFKELLFQATSSIKAFNEGKNFEIVNELASFLPALEESLEKCNESNLKCGEITECIQRLLLHRQTLKSISNQHKKPV